MTGLQEPHADESRAERHESLVDGSIRIRPQPELAEAMQPGIGTLHHPAIDAQTTAMLRPTLRDLWLDSPLPEFLSVWFRIVGPVRIQFFGLGGFVSFLPRKVRDAVHQG